MNNLFIFRGEGRASTTYLKPATGKIHLIADAPYATLSATKTNLVFVD